MAKLFANRIMAGKSILADVPAKLIDDVVAILTDMGYVISDQEGMI